MTDLRNDEQAENERLAKGKEAEEKRKNVKAEES